MSEYRDWDPGEPPAPPVDPEDPCGGGCCNPAGWQCRDCHLPACPLCGGEAGLCAGCLAARRPGVIPAVVNLTPHAIRLRGPAGDVVYPPSGLVARVNTTEESVPGMPWPTVRRSLEFVQVPAVLDGAWIVVSSLVLEAARQQGHRLLSRMVAPDTGPTAVREAGQVVAVTRMVVAGQ